MPEFEECCGERPDGQPDAADLVFFLGLFSSNRGCEHGCNSDSFWEGEVCFDDECSSEGDHPEDTKHASDEGDEGCFKVVDLGPCSKEDQGRDGEDDACGDAFSCGSTHGCDVDFQDGGFEWFHQGECHDGSRNDGGDGHPGV